MSAILRNEEKNWKAKFLGEIKLPKRGGYKPKKVELLKPFNFPKSIIYLFCTWCGRQYEFSYEDVSVTAEYCENDPLILPKKEEAKVKFYGLFLKEGDDKTGGCLCCKGPGWKKLSFEKISDLPD